jgi:hypothetical protein
VTHNNSALESEKTQILLRSLANINHTIKKLFESPEFENIMSHKNAKNFKEYISLLYFCHQFLEDFDQKIIYAKKEELFVYKKTLINVFKCIGFVAKELSNETEEFKDEIRLISTGILSKIKKEIEKISEIYQH